jgi:hypothetical protein
MASALAESVLRMMVPSIRLGRIDPPTVQGPTYAIPFQSTLSSAHTCTHEITVSFLD